ncbi:MAG: hypothetical protein U9O20_03675 [Patescibacteria group bacterium]|nr:hypothetical protein [Patescibacteria group bacterium]
MNKKLLTIISVLVFIALAGVVAFGMQRNRNEITIDQFKEVQDLFDGDFNETEMYKNADIRDWNTYKNEKMGFKMNIPQNWICEKIDYNEVGGELKRRAEKFEIEALTCFDEKGKGMSEEERMKSGYGYIVISYKTAKSEPFGFFGNTTKDFRKTLLQLKRDGSMLHLIDVGNEEGYLYGKISKKDDFTNNVSIESNHNGKNISTTCSQSGDFCLNVAKSIADTFQFLD